jgi:hypothetical protein
MSKPLLWVLCAAAALASAHARGTYHHSEPYVEHPDKHKGDSWAPVIVYSPEHHHYHKTHRSHS